jgi:mRNA interferase MazF
VVVQGDVWLTILDPTLGREIQKTRPCVVVSPLELHGVLPTVIVAPMTTGSKSARFRIPLAIDGKQGFILLDQIRTLDKMRLLKRLGKVTPKTLRATLDGLQELFAP